jgi:hypothetical protein
MLIVPELVVHEVVNAHREREHGTIEKLNRARAALGKSFCGRRLSRARVALPHTEGPPRRGWSVDLGRAAPEANRPAWRPVEVPKQGSAPSGLGRSGLWGQPVKARGAQAFGLDSGAFQPYAGLVRIRIISLAALSAAAFMAGPAGDALAVQRVTYSAAVRATGQLVVSFHGDPAAGCAASFRCDVQASTLRWTPPSRGQLYLSGIRGRRLRGFVAFYGPGPGLRTLTVVQRGAADGTHICADGRGESFEPYSSVVVGRRGLAFGLQGRPRVFGPLTQSQLATRCGGPLPADFVPDLPTRRVSLRALRRGPTRVDFAGSASFSAAGLAGTAQSTIALRVDRARVRFREPRRRPRRPERTAPGRPPIRNIAVEYRIARVTGSMPVDVAAEPRVCEPLDACGLSGRLTVTPGPARGEGYLYAYGRVSRAALRRAVGLARGPLPRRTSVYGYVSWSRARGTVSLDPRSGNPAQVQRGGKLNRRCRPCHQGTCASMSLMPASSRTGV